MERENKKNEKLGAETSRNRPVTELTGPSNDIYRKTMYTCILKQYEKKDFGIGMRTFKEL